VNSRTQTFKHTDYRRILLALLLGALLGNVGFAQAPLDTVQWVAGASSQSAVRSGSDTALQLSAQVLEGWHVYAFTQPPGGPMALRVTVDENAVAQAAGPPTGTVPEKKHDPSFDLETQFYTHSFVLRLPVHLKEVSAGRRWIPVSVRFQACSDRECLPPRTVHLSVPIEVLAET
jgi:hypothetical protein